MRQRIKKIVQHMRAVGSEMMNPTRPPVSPAISYRAKTNPFSGEGRKVWTKPGVTPVSMMRYEGKQMDIEEVMRLRKKKIK